MGLGFKLEHAGWGLMGAGAALATTSFMGKMPLNATVAAIPDSAALIGGIATLGAGAVLTLFKGK